MSTLVLVGWKLHRPLITVDSVVGTSFLHVPFCCSSICRLDPPFPDLHCTWPINLCGLAATNRLLLRSGIQSADGLSRGVWNFGLDVSCWWICPLRDSNPTLIRYLLLGKKPGRLGSPLLWAVLRPWRQRYSTGTLWAFIIVRINQPRHWVLLSDPDRFGWMAFV